MDVSYTTKEEASDFFKKNPNRACFVRANGMTILAMDYSEAAGFFDRNSQPINMYKRNNVKQSDRVLNKDEATRWFLDHGDNTKCLAMGKDKTIKWVESMAEAHMFFMKHGELYTDPVVENVQEFYKEKCIPLIDKIMTARNESDLEVLAPELGWPIEAVVAVWSVTRMGQMSVG